LTITEVSLLRGILDVLKEINERDKRMEEAMNQQRQFSSTAIMSAMDSMGKGGSMEKMFRDMALGKEGDDKGV
jgi:polyphosphate kinase 2 (PPK2 family)